MRNIDKDGFSRKKNRDWNKRQLIEKQREAWAVHTNRALELAGVKEKIDHRTLEEQGINRIPQIHLGANVNAMMKRGIATEKGDQWKATSEAVAFGTAVANQELMQTEREIESYRTYAQADFVLNNVGKTGNGGSRYFQGQTYRIEKLDETITISQNDNPSPIFVATYHQDDLGSLSVSSFDYQKEWQNNLNDLVTRTQEQLKQDEQKQQRIRRGRSL